MLKCALYDWFGLNEKLFYFINSFHSPAYDGAWVFITDLGRSQNFYIYYAILLILAGAAYARNVPMNNYYVSLSSLAVSFPLNKLIIDSLKAYFAYPRPFITLPEDSFFAIAPDVTFAQYWMSLPSGHAAFAVVMGAGLWPLLNRPCRAVVGVLVGLVGISRIILGMHFPADVIAGGAIGFAVVYASQHGLKKVFKQKA